MRTGESGGTLSDFLEREVLPRLSVEDVYTDVDFRSRRGRFWRAPCPLHKGVDPNFNVSVETLGWVCFSHCGSGSAVTYLNGGETPRGSRFVDIVRERARRAGVAMQEWHASPEERAASEWRHRRSELLEGYCALALRVLTTPAGAGAVAYLAGRGLPSDPVELARLGLGMAPSMQVMEQLRASGNELREAGLADSRWADRLVIPWRDRYGRVATIAARALDPADRSARYLYLAGAPLPPFFGLDHVRRARSVHSLIVTEGPLDALAVRVAGIDAVVALGGSQVGSRHMALLQDLGIEAVTLALDNDEAGSTATERFIHEARRSYPALRIQVIPPDAFGAAKDPSELIATAGGDAIYEAISHRLPANVHRARVALGDLAPDAPTGIRRDGLAAVRAVVEEAVGPERTADVEDIVSLAVERLGYPEHVVREALLAPRSGIEARTETSPASSMPPAADPAAAFDPDGLFHPLLWDLCKGRVPSGAKPIEDEVMWRIVDEIDQRLATVISLHYGRYGPMTSLADIAPHVTRHGQPTISRERVRQLRNKALTRLRHKRRFGPLFGLQPYVPAGSKQPRPTLASERTSPAGVRGSGPRRSGPPPELGWLVWPEAPPKPGLPLRHGQPWSEREEEALIQWAAHADMRTLVTLFGRKRSSITIRLGRLGITVIAGSVPATALSGRASPSAHEPTLPPRVRSAPRLDLPTWRSVVASELHVTPAAIASDELLHAIADAFPRTLADLARIPAVTQAFFEAYGEEILTVLRDGVEVPEWEVLRDDVAGVDDGDVLPF